MSKKILLLVSGMTPQIVTETVYGLAVKPGAGQQPWVPDEIHVISTTSGLTQVRATLFPTKDSEGYFQRLRADYGLPQIRFDESCLHLICDESRQPLVDLKTPLDNELAANAICDYVRQFTQDEGTELHVSIAGGRKTMGFYAGYALSLYGRPQDRMSHVLVSNNFENSREFFYPAPVPRRDFIIQYNKPEQLDAFDAEVWLANIPFVRLRDFLAPHSLIEKANFSEVVASLNMSRHPVQVELNVKKKLILVNGKECKMTPRAFAFYHWFALRVMHNEGPYKRPVEEEYRPMHDLWDLWKGRETIDPMNKKSGCLTKEHFEQALNEIKRTIAQNYGHSMLPKINIANDVQGDYLPLTASQITISGE